MDKLAGDLMLSAGTNAESAVSEGAAWTEIVERKMKAKKNLLVVCNWG